MSDPEVTREITPVDNELSETDIKVDAALSDLVRPGTEAAHTRHVRAGEEPCELCKAARSEALSRRRGA